MKKFLFITSMILFASISRLFPHIPNFSPIAAMALFGGVYLEDKRSAFIVPLLSMLLSDFFIGFHDTMIYVYASFICISLLGISIRRNINVLSIAACSLAASCLFFMVTNFGVWASLGCMNGLAGLDYTYAMGIPFFGPTMLGDLFYSGILFGTFYLVNKKTSVLQYRGF